MTFYRNKPQDFSAHRHYKHSVITMLMQDIVHFNVGTLVFTLGLDKGQSAVLFKAWAVWKHLGQPKLKRDEMRGHVEGPNLLVKLLWVLSKQSLQRCRMQGDRKLVSNKKHFRIFYLVQSVTLDFKTSLQFSSLSVDHPLVGSEEERNCTNIHSGAVLKGQRHLSR